MRWAARTIVQLHAALRACRPQLKREPLGSYRSPNLILDCKTLPLRQRASVFVPTSRGAARVAELVDAPGLVLEGE